MVWHLQKCLDFPQEKKNTPQRWQDLGFESESDEEQAVLSPAN